MTLAKVQTMPVRVYLDRNKDSFCHFHTCVVAHPLFFGMHTNDTFEFPALTG